MVTQEANKQRIIVYEIVDALNDLDNQCFELTKSHEVRDKFKSIRNLIKTINK